MDYTKLTLGDLLSAEDTIIKRNAMSILKQLQRTNACTRHTRPVGNCIKCNELRGIKTG